MSYIPNETEHNHSKSNVVDAVVLFKVDPVTRQITKVGDNDIVLVKNDHNSERYRISMPRYIDGHDMSVCDIARVHYINTGASSGLTSSDIYDADDLSLIVKDGETEETATEISFTWLVASTATKEYGRLAFAIELGCSSDSAENGYSWHSGVYSNIEVSDGIHNSQLITSIYGDILQSWWEKILAAMGGSIDEKTKEPFRFWVGTQAEYDAVVSDNQIIKDCMYFITDDNTMADIEKSILSAAETAEFNAKKYADGLASTAAEYTDERLGDIPSDSTAKDYADSVASTAESNAKSYADSTSATAESNAKSYADEKASTAESNAKTYADTHTSNKNNPHGVTAAQVGAYTKNETDDKILTEFDKKALRRALVHYIDPSSLVAEPVELLGSTHANRYLIYSGPLSSYKMYELWIGNTVMPFVHANNMKTGSPIASAIIPGGYDVSGTAVTFSPIFRVYDIRITNIRTNEGVQEADVYLYCSCYTPTSEFFAPAVLSNSEYLYLYEVKM